MNLGLFALQVLDMYKKLNIPEIKSYETYRQEEIEMEGI